MSIIQLRKHIERAYEDTEAWLSVVNDESNADTNAMKVEMKIKAPSKP
jgi:hypothetical protein